MVNERLPRVHRDEPQRFIVAKHLLEVAHFAQVVRVLVRSVREDGRTETFECRAIDDDQVNVIREQRKQRNAEHQRDEEQEENVEFADRRQLIRPELEEVVEGAGGRPEAHGERISQKQDEILVV
jgi:hypothetical protein